VWPRRMNSSAKARPNPRVTPEMTIFMGGK
jgi:hypothetical protein